jgi:hypothetical protein
MSIIDNICPDEDERWRKPSHVCPCPGDYPQFSKADIAALERCLLLQCARSEVDKQQINDQLAHKDWAEVATSICYDVQYAALQCKPWQSVPCWGFRDGPLTTDSNALLEKLLEAGFSQFEPDPNGALRARAEHDAP